MSALKIKLNSEKILIFFFLNIFLFPIYPSNLKPSLVVLLLLATFFYCFKNKGQFNFKEQRTLFFVNTSLFFSMVLSLVYSPNVSSGLSVLFRLLPLVIFPIIFVLLSNKNVITERIILKGYMLFYIATVLLFLAFFIYFYFNGNITVNFLRNYNERINTKLGRYCIHPIYGSIYVSVALILSITLLKKQILNRTLVIVLNFLLVLNLILLARKSAIIIMIILFVIYQLKFWNIKLVYKAMSIMALIIGAIAIVIFVPDISYRFNEFIYMFSANKERGSIGLRLSILQCSYETILNNPIFGYGIGGVKSTLLECYKTIPEVFNGKYYNSHNQYLTVWLTSGILGLISLVGLFYYNFTKAIKTKNFIFVAILILFSCIMLIESILLRQDGILLFSLFINLFAFIKSREFAAKKPTK